MLKVLKYILIFVINSLIMLGFITTLIIIVMGIKYNVYIFYPQFDDILLFIFGGLVFIRKINEIIKH